jgi:hypothetical protein
VARDITRIAAEIMAENFQAKTLLEMSQLEVPSEAQIAQQAAPLEQQVAKIMADAQAAMRDPNAMAMAQQNPQQAQQIIQQAQQQAGQLQQQIDKLKETVTIEKVIAFLRDQRLRPFVLDIETDSTIAPDENATKQRATEFLTAIGGFMREAMPLAQTLPQAGPLMAETLKYSASQFRAGRPLEGAIEEFADQVKQLAQQPKPPAPEQIKAQADAQATQADAAEKQANAQKTMQETQAKAAKEQQDLAIRQQEAADAAAERYVTIEGKKAVQYLDIQQKKEKHAQDMDIGAQQLLKAHLEIERLRCDMMKPEVEEAPEKAPSESINFKDLPPEGQSQMAAQAGIDLSPETLASHADDMAAQALEAKQAARPKEKEPA